MLSIIEASYACRFSSKFTVFSPLCSASLQSCSDSLWSDHEQEDPWHVVVLDMYLYHAVSECPVTLVVSNRFQSSCYRELHSAPKFVFAAVHRLSLYRGDEILPLAWHTCVGR